MEQLYVWGKTSIRFVKVDYDEIGITLNFWSVI